MPSPPPPRPQAPPYHAPPIPPQPSAAPRRNLPIAVPPPRPGPFATAPPSFPAPPAAPRATPLAPPQPIFPSSVPAPTPPAPPPAPIRRQRGRPRGRPRGSTKSRGAAARPARASRPPAATASASPPPPPSLAEPPVSNPPPPAHPTAPPHSRHPTSSKLFLSGMQLGAAMRAAAARPPGLPAHQLSSSPSYSPSVPFGALAFASQSSPQPPAHVTHPAPSSGPHPLPRADTPVSHIAPNSASSLAPRPHRPPTSTAAFSPSAEIPLSVLQRTTERGNAWPRPAPAVFVSPSAQISVGTKISSDIVPRTGQCLPNLHTAQLPAQASVSRTGVRTSSISTSEAMSMPRSMPPVEKHCPSTRVNTDVDAEAKLEAATTEAPSVSKPCAMPSDVAPSLTPLVSFAEHVPMDSRSAASLGVHRATRTKRPNVPATSAMRMRAGALFRPAWTSTDVDMYLDGSEDIVERSSGEDMCMVDVAGQLASPAMPATSGDPVIRSLQLLTTTRKLVIVPAQTSPNSSRTKPIVGRSGGTGPRQQEGMPHVGMRVGVWWEDREEEYIGVLAERASGRGRHAYLVVYDDGDRLTHDLDDIHWRRLVDDDAGQWLEPGELSEMERERRDGTFETRAQSSGRLATRSMTRLARRGDSGSSLGSVADSGAGSGGSSGSSSGEDVVRNPYSDLGIGTGPGAGFNAPDGKERKIGFMHGQLGKTDGRRMRDPDDRDDASVSERDNQQDEKTTWSIFRGSPLPAKKRVGLHNITKMMV